MEPRWKVLLRARGEHDGSPCLHHEVWVESFPETEVIGPLLEDLRRLYVEKFGKPPIVTGHGVLPLQRELDGEYAPDLPVLS